MVLPKESKCQLLLDRLEENEKQDPSKAAFSFISSGLDGGNISKSVTYRELSDQTTALAKYLLTCTGLKKGDRYECFESHEVKGSSHGEGCYNARA